MHLAYSYGKVWYKGIMVIFFTRREHWGLLCASAGQGREGKHRLPATKNKLSFGKKTKEGKMRFECGKECGNRWKKTERGGQTFWGETAVKMTQLFIYLFIYLK